MERESGVKGEWERWRERAPVLLESGPLVVNQSWQPLSLTLSPLLCRSPLIPLGTRHHGKTPPPHTHTLSPPPPTLCCRPFLTSFPPSWAGLVLEGARDKHQACGTNRPLMWADRTDNWNQVHAVCGCAQA